MTPKQMQEFLEHAPKSPGPIVDGLLGSTTPEGYFYCSTCTGRLCERGMGPWTAGWTPVWATASDENYRRSVGPDACDACGRKA